MTGGIQIKLFCVPWPRAVRAVVLVAALGAAFVLASGSSRGRRGLGGSGSVTGAGPFRPERAGRLNHPALLLINRTDQVVDVTLSGPMKRQLAVPPHGVLRTITAAGVYKYRIACKGQPCPFKPATGRLRFLKKRRYVLKLK